MRPAARGTAAVTTVLLLLALAAAPALAQQSCSSEGQVVNCGQLPVDSDAEFFAYRQCCRLFRPLPLSARVQTQARAAQLVQAQMTARADLTGTYDAPLTWSYSRRTCPRMQSVFMPAFGPAAKTTALVQRSIPVLTAATIQRIRSAALTALGANAATASIRTDAAAITTTSTYTHPVAGPGPGELALMRYKVAQSQEPQRTAWTSLLTGSNVVPKTYSGTWTVPTDTPQSWAGPYAAAQIDIRYGGLSSNTSQCPANFPAAARTTAAWNLCGHVSLVELDAQQSYKQALAWRATRNTAYADNVFRILSAWSSTNKAWGVRNQNGPLEAGWAIAAMARALELMRGHPSFSAARSAFNAWVNTYPLPDMDHYIDVQTANAVTKVANVYNNWHSTIAEAFMALGVLNDDAGRVRKAHRVFELTVSDYFKWARTAPHITPNRTLGECSETLRDIYHSEFGLGGLITIAEMAFQQNNDTLYRFGGAALASALELHARIINAALERDELQLPDVRYKWQSQMPAPPAGCEWAFDIAKQLWFARSRTNGTRYNDLLDGNKYVLGAWFLPTNWDVAYNHYAGRLGLPMPETQRLLVRYPVEWFEFHWGLGTLTHAASATSLWRNGMTSRTVCT